MNLQAFFLQSLGNLVEVCNMKIYILILLYLIIYDIKYKFGFDQFNILRVIQKLSGVRNLFTCTIEVWTH